MDPRLFARAAFATVVGSRETPPGHLAMMRRFNVLLAERYHLRSGHAPGADLTVDVTSNVTEYLPYPGFNGARRGHIVKDAEILSRAESIAAGVHSAWRNVTPDARRLHTRNVFQVLGETLDAPSILLVCWTKGGVARGGTATAIRIAENNAIPVFNVALSDDIDRLRETLGVGARSYDRRYSPGALVLHQNRARLGTEYVGRAAYGNAASEFANPFPLRREDERGSTLTDFASYLLLNEPVADSAKRSLLGRNLSCWCAGEDGLRPDDTLHCHGQILLRAVRGDYDRDFAAYSDIMMGRSRIFAPCLELSFEST